MFKFYKNGLVTLINETKLAGKLKSSKNLTRTQHRMVYRNSNDLNKLLPFFLFSLIAPELLPFALLKGVNILPSTLITENQLVMFD